MLSDAPEALGTNGRIRSAVDGLADALWVAATFRVHVVHEPGGVRVCPIGELDIATADQIGERLNEATRSGAGRVILDLRKTTFLDSTGLHLAVQAHRSATANGTEFALIAGPPAVQRAFEIVGLSARLPFVDPRGLPD